MTASFEVVPTGALHGRVSAPASKSVTNRVLLLAALATGTSVVHTPLVSEDSAAMRALVEGFGAGVVEVGHPGEADHCWQVTGTGGRVATPLAPLDCRLSGTTIRFGSAVAALAEGQVTLTGRAPLLRRPLGPLSQALRDLGATVSDHDGLPPVTVGGGLAGGTVAVDVTGSSQFASAVLLAAPYARADVVLSAIGAHAGAYIRLTVEGMVAWGADVGAVPGGEATWHVRAAGRAGAGYLAQDVVVEFDASAAAHLYALAVASGGRVTVLNVSDTLQPDAGILDVLVRFGAAVERDGAAVTVTGPDQPTAAGTVDLSRMPDQVTTVAALAALALGETTIVGAEVVRGHETDRLAALATELRKVGAAVDERPDGLVVDGTRSSGRTVLDTYHDHRLAMSFAAIGTRLPGVVVNDPSCVAKTYPDFWQVLVSLGGELRTR